MYPGEGEVKQSAAAVIAIRRQTTYVLFEMTGCKKKSRLLPFLLLVMVTFASAWAEAQDDYPLPPGNPSDWGIPGRPEELLPEAGQTSAPDVSSSPSPGNVELGQPSVPEGEAQEEYKGTADPGFGGVAGTGIGQSGAPSAP